MTLRGRAHVTSPYLDGEAGGQPVVGSTVLPYSRMLGASQAAGRSMGGLDPTDLPERHQAELEEAAAVIKAAGLSAELFPAVGHPAETIVQIAGDEGADMIVVGTREPGFVERLLGQSTSQAVDQPS